jgi:hypothetical protein
MLEVLQARWSEGPPVRAGLPVRLRRTKRRRQPAGRTAFDCAQDAWRLPEATKELVAVSSWQAATLGKAIAGTGRAER